MSVKLQIRVSLVTVIQILMRPKSKSTVRPIVTGFVALKLPLGNFIPKHINEVYFRR